uniref:Uncharacterized protein n=1 Tax=Romanomermis culicivorax TaxID=13658 RepID=A0A915L0P1_ROMCU
MLETLPEFMLSNTLKNLVLCPLIAITLACNAGAKQQMDSPSKNDSPQKDSPSPDFSELLLEANRLLMNGMMVMLKQMQNNMITRPQPAAPAPVPSNSVPAPSSVPSSAAANADSVNDPEKGKRNSVTSRKNSAQL